jgi:hypothetical protein
MNEDNTRCQILNRIVPFRIMMGICGILISMAIMCPPARATEDMVVRLGSDIVIEPGVEVEGVVSIGGSVRVYGQVIKNVIVVGGAVFLGEDAVVHGDVVSVGGPVVKQHGAKVNGKITSVETPWISSVFSGFAVPELPKMHGFLPFIGFLLIAVCIVALIPSTVGYISFNLEYDTLKAFAWGVLGTVLVLPLVFIFIISIVGIVLIPVLMILVACAFLLGYVAVSQLVGKKITIAVKKPDKPILLETLLGVVVLSGIGLIPFFGWLVQTIAAIGGFGGVISSIISRRKQVKAS